MVYDMCVTEIVDYRRKTAFAERWPAFFFFFFLKSLNLSSIE